MAEHVFTDDEIRQIIDVINRTKHTQYIGARYVPVFGRVNEDSIEWDNSAPYEPLTIVLHQGNSYTSRQYVPAGVEITNEQYWANTGNYNAQVEQYRKEVAAYDGRITAAQNSANNAQSSADKAQSSADKANEKLSSIGVDTTEDGRGLKNKIERMDTDIATNKGIFNSWNINSIQDGIKAKNDFEENYLTKTEIENKYQEKSTLTTMVVFGDSMTTCGSTDTAQWWAIVAAKLGLTPRSYGHGGSGFVNVSDGYSYDTELQGAINDETLDKNTVKYVFVNASSNDAGQAQAAETKALRWGKLCRETFPHAQLIAFAGLQGRTVRHTQNNVRLMNYFQQYMRVGAALASVGFHVFTNSAFWLIYNRALTQEDSLHPNDAGLEAIADYVLSGLQSGVYTAISHSMGAIEPISMTPLLSGGDKTQWIANNIEAGFCGGDRTGAIYPFASLAADYASWQAMPDINSAVFYFHNLRTALSKADVTKYATSQYTIPAVVSGGSSGTNVPIGLDIPICPVPYPFGTSNVHGEAIARWSDGLDIRINGYAGAINAYLYQKAEANVLDTPADARHWLWLHFDWIPVTKSSFWASQTSGGATTRSVVGIPSCYDLGSTDTVNISISGRIIIPIAGMWRP